MRIILCSDTLEKGGTEKQLSIEAEHLHLAGHEVFVFALSSGGWWRSYLEERGIAVNVLNFYPLAKFSFKNIAEFFKLLACIRKIQPDVVAGFLYHCSVLTSVAAYLAKVNVVVACRRDCGFLRKNYPFPRSLEKLSYLVTTKFTANSVAVRNCMIKDEGIDPAKIEVIYNGINLPIMNDKNKERLRNKLNIPENFVVVGMLANFWPHKNHIMLIKAADLVLKNEPQVIFILIGRYYKYQEQVENEINILGLKKHFLIKKAVESPYDILPAIDIGIICSESEGFSNAILEYMAYGIPVISTRVGGSSEAIVHAETGYLVNFNDHKAMGQAIVDLIKFPDKRKRMGHSGRLRAEEKFSWEASIKSWNLLYNNLLKPI